jgi:hypothetical protein
LQSKNLKLKNGMEAIFEQRKGWSGNTGRPVGPEELERIARFFAARPEGSENAAKNAPKFQNNPTDTTGS